jgi:multiple sugar transport system permease protein
MATVEENLPTASTPKRIRWRAITDSVTGLVFIAPAFLVIFVFGLFPILFSVYVSLHQWRINPGDYIGLGNFVRAFGSLAYVLAFWIAALLIYMAVQTLRKFFAENNADRKLFWQWLVPGLMTAVGAAAFVKFSVELLPEILGIAQKVRGKTPTQELFVSLLGEAWNVPAVQTAFRQFLLVAAAGIVISYMIYRLIGGPSRSMRAFSTLSTFFIMIGIAGVLAWVTWTEIQGEYIQALEEGEVLSLWSQIVTISAGFVLLLLSWLSWRGATKQGSNLSMVLRLTAGAMLLVGAWVLIAELPRAVQSGDEDWWLGLLVTVYYSLGTVPFQLGISLFLAVLLFQEIRGKSFFRLIYFLPYIKPAVASAAFFRVLFSGSSASLSNRIIGLFGVQPQLWLDQPDGIFRLIGGEGVPEFLAGPSMALVVIILFNIWSYVGYDIVIFLAGLGGIPSEMYEAAQIDGAGRWAQFRHITFPLLSPTTYFLTLLAVIGTFKAFNHVWVLRTSAALGTVDTASIVIFTEFNRNTRYGYAAALALLLFLIILVLTIINNRVAEERVFYG